MTLRSLADFDDVVNYATSKGLKIEIEPHNYGYGFGSLIGSGETPNSSFADLWGKLAVHYKSNPDVIFGLMNEPHVQTATEWLSSANAAIAAIRSAGAAQQILVPGSYYDGAWTWTTSDNAAVIGTGVQNPLHNFAFEVHQYLDFDGSGTHPGVVSPTIGIERVTAVTQWAEATGNHLFLGEVGVSTDQTSLTALDGMLSYILQHTNVWEGATYWAGGPWWGTYMFSIEPENGVDKPQMAILLKHLTPAPTSLPPPTADDLQIAVAVEASMYGVVGTSAEVTLLATQFLPPQVAFAAPHGFNAQVYASEALGLALAFRNETGSTGFADAFGPLNPTMPNSTAGDLAFATTAARAIFGPSSTANLVNVMDTWVTNWKAFYSNNGIPGISNPTAAQVDLAARGAAWAMQSARHWPMTSGHWGIRR